MIFFHHGDCGCAQTGNDTPSCPPAQGALVSDNRYLSLATTGKGQVIVVPKGSNSQVYLTAAFAGLVMFRDGEIEVSRTPALALPILNPATSGTFPLPGGFKYLFAGTGDPAEWRHVAAPTTGVFILHSDNGVWVLKDAGSIPGIQTIGSSGTTSAKVAVVGLVNTGTDESPVWTIRRVTVQDGHPLVGYVDPDTSEASYRALPTASFLTHPKANFTTLQCRTLETTDVDGVPIAGGMEQAVMTGTGALADPTRIVYSPTTKRLYLAPAHTVQTTLVSVNASTIVPPTSYATMPGGHGAGVNVQYNYTKVRVDFNAGLSSGAASNTQTFGIFRDGVLLSEFDNDNLLSVGITYIDQACPPGPHTYDVRWKKTSGSTSVIVRNSSLVVSTQS